MGCRGILVGRSVACSCPELAETVVVVVGKLVVLPRGWQVVEERQEGQTGQVEEAEHRTRSLQGEAGDGTFTPVWEEGLH